MKIRALLGLFTPESYTTWPSPYKVYKEANPLFEQKSYRPTTWPSPYKVYKQANPLFDQTSYTTWPSPYKGYKQANPLFDQQLTNHSETNNQ